MQVIVGPGATFSLDRLKKPFHFPTEPEDGIKSVEIVKMRLKPYSSKFDVVLIKGSNESIYESIGAQFGYESPVAELLVIKEVKLAISFDGDDEEKIAPRIIKIKSCGKCTLKIPDSKSILIITKYPKYWGLINEHSS